jgi:A1 cistron-splicing factor AAR2
MTCSIIFPELKAPDILSSVGIGRLAWEPGPRFHGIKAIPSGFHIFTLVRKSMQTSTQSILLYSHKEAPVLAFKWSEEEESFISYSSPDIERISTQGLSARLTLLAIPQFDSMMAPYPTTTPESIKWSYDSRFITRSLLDRICPGSSVGFTADSMTTCSYHSQADLTSAIPEFSGDTLVFTKIDLKNSSLDSDMVTKYSMDKSLLFTRVLKEVWNGKVSDFLGELQASFLMFHTAQLFDGFEQWKLMLHLVLMCDECIPEYAEFFITLLGISSCYCNARYFKESA